jgi:hypothetical protein
VTLAELGSRLHRFLPRAARAAMRDLSMGSRSAARNVAATWRATDPHRSEKLAALLASRDPEWQLVRERDERRRADAWARLVAAGRATYEGELRARPAMRGLMLDDIEGRPALDSWLADTLGLDDWHGTTRRVRLIVEPLPDPGGGPADAPEPTGGDVA